jgi:hypothetical protein
MTYLGSVNTLQDILYQVTKLKLTITDFKSKSGDLNHENPSYPQYNTHAT